MASNFNGGTSFLPQRLESHLVSDLTDFWFSSHTLECRKGDNGQNQSQPCPISTSPVAFHYVMPYEMYVFEYLLYVVKML
jgi:hypothetical protein